ncbi:MAG: hypothetical protein WBP56_08270 [Polyangia bacterium]
MTLAVDLSGVRGQLLRAKAEGKYCSGCALDMFAWLAEHGPIPRLSRPKAARDWLDVFERTFAVEDKAQLVRDGKCKICRRPRASALRLKRALGLN